MTNGLIILADERTFRTFNVIDDFNREGLAIDVYSSLPAAKVTRSLDQILEWRNKPLAIRCDNGPEYCSAELQYSGQIVNKSDYFSSNRKGQHRMVILKDLREP